MLATPSCSEVFIDFYAMQFVGVELAGVELAGSFRYVEAQAESDNSSRKCDFWLTQKSDLSYSLYL